MKIYLRLLTLLMSLGFVVPAQAYTFDELPQQWTYPFVAEPSTDYLSHYQSSKNLMMDGSLHFPVSWNSIKAGQSVRLRVLIPPGVDWAAVGTNTPNMVGTGYACDGIVSARNEAGCTRLSMPGNHGLFPIVQGTPVPNKQARIVSMVIQADNYMGFTFGDMTITWHIADMTEYKKWRSARRWAGGSGDCDGLGNAYAPQCDTSFAIELSSSTVESSGGFSLTATGGKIKSCSSDDDSLKEGGFEFNEDKTSATAKAPSVNAEKVLKIVCLSDSLASAERSITVQAPTLTITGKLTNQGTGVSMTIEADIPSEDVGKEVRLFVVAESTHPFSKQKSYVVRNETGRWELLPDHPMIERIPATVSEPSLNKKFNYTLKEDKLSREDLELYDVKIFLAYQRQGIWRVSNALNAYLRVE